jgi:hypothetical protein
MVVNEKLYISIMWIIYEVIRDKNLHLEIEEYNIELFVNYVI